MRKLADMRRFDDVCFIIGSVTRGRQFQLRLKLSNNSPLSDASGGGLLILQGI